MLTIKGQFYSNFLIYFFISFLRLCRLLFVIGQITFVYNLFEIQLGFKIISFPVDLSLDLIRCLFYLPHALANLSGDLRYLLRAENDKDHSYNNKYLPETDIEKQ